MTRKLINAALLLVIFGVLGLGVSVAGQAQGQKSRTPMANSLKQAEATNQPLYTEYRGVRIGMTADEARAKLGQPAMKADDQDYYMFAETETVQVAYDATHKVVCISIDYMGGVGAPDYRNVVGADIQTKPNGSMYKLVRYEQLGFWVSYNRTASDSVVIVTITIQKIAQ